MGPENLCPLVSVIVPAFNEAENIPLLVSSLRQQDYPREKIEILIVDNNSTDNTEEVIRAEGLKYLREETPGNSYASRNLAIKHSRGEILAFTDGDCRVDPAWIKNGVKCLKENNADMAAGNSVYEFPRNSVSGRYSRRYFGRQEYLAENWNASATNNLFMTRKVIEKTGLFDQRFRYGGDTHYTSNAGKQGFRMVFCRDACIHHHAHAGIKEIAKKWWRTGFGEAQKYCLYGDGEYGLRKWRWYLPGWRQVKEFKNAENLSPLETFQAFFIIWLTKIAFLKGNRDGIRYCREL